MATNSDPVVAVSFERYRATAAQRRAHGGGTVTRFYVYRRSEEGDASRYAVVEGFGRTPGERKTDAIRRYEALPRVVTIPFAVERKSGLSDSLVGDAQARMLGARHGCESLGRVDRNGHDGPFAYRFRGPAAGLRALCHEVAGSNPVEGDRLFSMAKTEVKRCPE